MGYVLAPIVACFSCMASSMAAWVLALDLLISSSSTTLACTGPSSVVNVPLPGLNTWVPMMSLGSRSGVHCTREKLASTVEASVEAASVLAKPGTDSRSTWPPPINPTSSAVRNASWPTTFESKVCEIASTRRRA